MSADRRLQNVTVDLTRGGDRRKCKARPRPDHMSSMPWSLDRPLILSAGSRRADRGGRRIGMGPRGDDAEAALKRARERSPS